MNLIVKNVNDGFCFCGWALNNFDSFLQKLYVQKWKELSTDLEFYVDNKEYEVPNTALRKIVLIILHPFFPNWYACGWHKEDYFTLI